MIVCRSLLKIVGIPDDGYWETWDVRITEWKNEKFRLEMYGGLVGRGSNQSYLTTILAPEAVINPLMLTLSKKKFVTLAP
jgi:hypothetical protein